jgi:group I intron endonuclease
MTKNVLGPTHKICGGIVYGLYKSDHYHGSWISFGRLTGGPNNNEKNRRLESVGSLLLASKYIKDLSGIYAIRNILNNQIYIGSAANLSRRCSEHYRMLNRGSHENVHLQHAWNKYGSENFLMTILFYCQEDDLLWFEQRAIDIYRDRIGWRMLYNQAPVAGSRLHLKHSDATKAKMRVNNSRHFLGRTHSIETRKRIAELSRIRWKDPTYRAKYLGRTCSEETKRKIGLANTGKIRSKSTREKISRYQRGKVVSGETKGKLVSSPRFLGHHHSEETKTRISEMLQGREFSVETRRKISEGVIRSKRLRGVAEQRVAVTSEAPSVVDREILAGRWMDGC